MSAVYANISHSGDRDAQPGERCPRYSPTSLIAPTNGPKTGKTRIL